MEKLSSYSQNATIFYNFSFRKAFKAAFVDHMQNVQKSQEPSYNWMDTLGFVPAGCLIVHQSKFEKMFVSKN